jgi:hypothetical protein
MTASRSTDEKRALLAELEAEAERRLNAMVEAGEAIRLSAIVATVGDAAEAEIEAAKTHALAEHVLKAPEDASKWVVWDEVIVTTGVPRPSPEERAAFAAKHKSSDDDIITKPIPEPERVRKRGPIADLAHLRRQYLGF